MQEYKKDRYRSRKASPLDWQSCEFEGCGATGVDVHHITQSFRGKRTHKRNGTDIILLCREHHERIHKRNNHQNRMMLLDRVRLLLLEKRKWKS